MCSLASRHLLTRLHRYTPNRPALSCHFSKTAQSGAVVPRCDGPRLMSDSSPVLTSRVQSGIFRQEGGHNVGTKQLCDLFVVVAKYSHFLPSFPVFISRSVVKIGKCFNAENS